MDWLIDFITNKFFITAVASWTVAQVLKVFIYAIINKTWDFSRLFGDGGMPSGHSATVMSLAVASGLAEGFDSTCFGIAMIFAIIVMHDALGVRRETGKQAVSIIKMAELLNDYFHERDKHIKTDKLKILVGHTPWQVVVGAFIGIAVAVFAWFLFPDLFLKCN
jgi:acid phosphatase family membrane protein YuiD